MCLNWHLQIELNGVSVPYRGATFLNNTSTLPRNILSGFRPLSGSYISQLSGRINEREDTVFPSPIGELHFSMNLAAEVKKLREEFSVPYRGATFLNMTTKINSALNEGFRPLSGSYISQWCCYVFCQISVLRFRPLSGSYISQLRSKM